MRSILQFVFLNDTIVETDEAWWAHSVALNWLYKQGE